MGLGKRILGYVSAPFVSARNDGNRWIGSSYSAADDCFEENDYPTKYYVNAQGLPVVPMTRYLEIGGGDTLANRQSGTYNLIPGRALSAQTRLKNMSWELPAANWTINPDGEPYILRVPGLPQTIYNLPTQTNFTTQPEFLQPITNLQIQNDMSWLQQFRAAIFGQATQQQTQQNAANMFPSIFGNNISVDLGNTFNAQ